MKKSIFILLLFVSMVSFADSNSYDDYGFILFQMNSSNMLDASVAKNQLDEMAKKLIQQKLEGEQIHVSGYTAKVDNAIDEIELSAARANKIVTELQNRGVPSTSFSPIEAKGSTFEWGNNSNEAEQRLNRRVIIAVEKKEVALVLPDLPENNNNSSDEPLSETKEDKRAFTFPWWILIVMLLIITSVLFGISVLNKPVSNEDKDNPGKGVPPEVMDLLREKGLTRKEQKQFVKDHSGKGDSKIPLSKDFCNQSIDYITKHLPDNLSSDDPNKRAQAELVTKNPNLEQILKNYRDAAEGKKKIEKTFRDYVKNYGDFAYASTNLEKTLGLKTFPSGDRWGNDDKGRPGIFRLADLSFEIDQGKLSKADTARVKILVPKIYEKGNSTPGELAEFKKIIAPLSSYSADGMTKHEEVDGKTIHLLPSGELHSGSDANSRVSHKGGHSLSRDADEIIKNRKK